MREKGFDTLVIACPANIHYLTGFDGWGYYMPNFVVLRQDAEEEAHPVLIARGMDAGAGAFSTHLPLNRVFGYADELIDSEHVHPMSVVCDLLLQQGWSKGTVALEMCSDYFTARHLTIAQEELGPAKLVNDNRVVNWVRMIKSEAELDKIREAAVIVDSAIQTAIDTLAKDPFSRGCDLIAEVPRAEPLSPFEPTWRL